MKPKILSAVSLALFATLLLSACAAPTTKRMDLDPELVAKEERAQQELAIRRTLEYNERLHRVAYPLLKASTPLCGTEVAPRLGFASTNKWWFDKKTQEYAEEAFGIGDTMQVIQVTEGAPAYVAGLAVGDKLVRINGVAVPTGKKGFQKTSDLLEDALKKSDSIAIEVERDGAPMTITVQAEKICRYRPVLANDDSVNAFADGNNIIMTRGMLRFASDDKQLALVVAHELAHNSQKHIQAKTTNYLLGSILDIAAAAYGVNTGGAFGNAAAMTYSKEFEAEADYVGLYMMSLAEMDITEAADFWREMGSENPGAITRQFASSHPATAERYLAIQQTIEEIARKRENGEPLRPDPKE